jgi:hypothetical protein
MRRILDFSSGSWTAFPPLDRQAAAALEQNGRPEVEASMQRCGKGDEACSVASGKGEKCGGVGGDAIHESGRRQAKVSLQVVWAEMKGLVNRRRPDT